MKSVKTIALCLAALSLGACNKALEESEYRNFSLKNASGQEVESGIYLPKGYSSKSNLPVVYICDDLVLKTSDKYCHVLDSLVDNMVIRPVAVVIAGDLSLESVDYFANTFKPYVEKHWAVDSDRDGTVFCGSMTSADAGLVMSFSHQEIISEYWLSAPVQTEIDGYGMLDNEIQYHFMWSSKDESFAFDEYSSMLNYIRKRGGHVKKQTFSGIADGKTLRDLFCANMAEHFPLF